MDDVESAVLEELRKFLVYKRSIMQRDFKVKANKVVVKSGGEENANKHLYIWGTKQPILKKIYNFA